MASFYNGNEFFNSFLLIPLYNILKLVYLLKLHKGCYENNFNLNLNCRNISSKLVHYSLICLLLEIYFSLQ